MVLKSENKFTPTQYTLDKEQVKYKKLLTMTKKRVDSQEVKGQKVANL